MLKKLPVQPQLEMFKTVLTSFIHPEHELCLLAKKIDWKSLEEEFAPLYGTVGRPSVPIRTIVGLLLLKQMYNLGDETVVERYLENPYWQHFCGEVYFQYKLPFDPSDFVHFRHRIGPEGIKLKRTFGREIKKLKHQLRFARKPKNMKKHIKAQKRLHRIAFKIYIDLVKQLNPIPKSYQDELDVLYRALTQKRDDKNKVYSIHEPETLCISKGKEHKPYEFGNKSLFAYTRESGIIVGAMAIEGIVYDGRTLKPQLDQVKELTGGKIKNAIVEQGYKVPGGIPGIDIVMPKVLKGESYYKKKKREERCRSRAGVEGLISHLKHDHRMIRNYLSGTAGDQINTLLAAAVYNMKKWMRLEKQKLLGLIFGWIYQRLILVPVISNATEYKKNRY